MLTFLIVKNHPPTGRIILQIFILMIITYAASFFMIFLCHQLNL